LKKSEKVETWRDSPDIFILFLSSSFLIIVDLFGSPLDLLLFYQDIHTNQQFQIVGLGLISCKTHVVDDRMSVTWWYPPFPSHDITRIKASRTWSVASKMSVGHDETMRIIDSFVTKSFVEIGCESCFPQDQAPIHVPFDLGSILSGFERSPFSECTSRLVPFLCHVELIGEKSFSLHFFELFVIHCRELLFGVAYDVQQLEAIHSIEVQREYPSIRLGLQSIQAGTLSRHFLPRSRPTPQPKAPSLDRV
jgi:hypothetical protein